MFRFATSLRALMVIGFLSAFSATSMAEDSEMAFEFNLRDLNGDAVTMEGLRGNVVVLSFWATWCAPCKEEMPHLQKMYEAKKDDGLVVLSISIDDARAASRVKPFIKKMGYTFPVVLDRDSSVIGYYNPSKGVPYTVIVDREGRVAYRASGYNPGDEVKLADKVDALLAQSGS